jgi:hypothetical protein
MSSPSDLHPTPTRLDGLRAAGRQTLFRLPSGETRLYFDDGTYRTVNARVGELEAAGWLTVGGELHAAPMASQRRWRYLDLTAAGRAVLADG